MRILVTHELFPPDIAGGGEILTHTIVKGLIGIGHDVEVVTSGNPDIKEFDGIKTHRYPFNRYLMNLSYYEIRKHAKNFDIILTSSGNMAYPSFKVARSLKIPVVCYIHHVLGKYWKDVHGSFLGTIFQLAEHHILSHPFDAIIYQNKNSFRLLPHNEERLHLLQPGIDYKKFQLNLEREPFVLFVGNFKMDKQMCNYKGLKYFIEAAGYFPNTQFDVVGEGSHLDNIKRKLPQDSNIIFMGAMDQDELIKLYNRALIYCCSSVTEGFGIALQEAMASGCAIVSTVDIGQDGILTLPKSTAGIVEGLKIFINNTKKAKMVGMQNRELSKKFSWKKYFDDFEKILEGVK